MNEIFNYVATFFSGVILKHFWDKIVHRIIILRYTVIHQQLALSGNDPRFGSIQVHFNDIPSNNLYLSTVTITNDSNKDVQNIEINLLCDQKSFIFSSQGFVKSNFVQLNFTDKYAQLLSDGNTTSPRTVLSFRDYIVPVFNRGDSLEFSMIVNSDNLGVAPSVFASCNHLGVKMKFQKLPPQKLFGESQGLSALIGLLITAIICYLIVSLNCPLNYAVWASYLLGGTAAVSGVIAIKIFKRLRRFFT